VGALETVRHREWRRQHDDQQIEPGIAHDLLATRRKHQLTDVLRAERRPDDQVDGVSGVANQQVRRAVLENQGGNDEQREERERDVRGTFQPLESLSLRRGGHG
jgi:hypothetical protein